MLQASTQLRTGREARLGLAEASFLDAELGQVALCHGFAVSVADLEDRDPMFPFDLAHGGRGLCPRLV